MWLNAGFLIVDTLSKKERSKRMSLVRAKDTKAEMVVRRLVHSLGYRYRLHDGEMPGKPDLVFKSRKKVIFVHGCFRHRHDDCKLARLPKSKLDFRLPKLAGNKARDQRNQENLDKMGWKFMVVWECLIKDIVLLREQVKAFLNDTNGVVK